MRVFLEIAYDGTAYHGWQLQEGVPTVQEEVERAICDLLSEQVSVTGASRTDAGVHALGNVAVFDTNSSIPADRFKYALNERLPEDIKIMDSKEVAPDFNPRYDAISKTYVYTINDAHILPPTERLYCCHSRQHLDEALMDEAAKHFTGEHDFTSVASVHSQTNSYVRTIFACDVRRDAEKVEIKISGSGFLYNMVRIISGTLMQVGLKKIKPEEIPAILSAKDRSKAGPTLVPQGLCLKKIFY